MDGYDDQHRPHHPELWPPFRGVEGISADGADGHANGAPDSYVTDGIHVVNWSDQLRVNMPLMRVELPRNFVPVERWLRSDELAPATVPAITPNGEVAWLTDADLERLEKWQDRRAKISNRLLIGALIFSLLSLGETLYKTRQGLYIGADDVLIKAAAVPVFFIMAIPAVVYRIRALIQSDRIEILRRRLEE